MTQILACLTDDFVLQVADRRLVRRNPRTRDFELVDDEANKAVVWCGHHVFGYTGLAEIDDEPTDWWIARILGPTRSLGEALVTLREAATDRFARLPGTREDKRLVIVGVGWARPEKSAPYRPVLTWVSNCAGPNGWLPEALDKFSMGRSRLPPNAVQVISAGQPFRSERCTQLGAVIIQGLRGGQGAAMTVRLLTTEIRDVADRNPAVGKGALVSVLPRASVPVTVSMSFGAPIFRDDQATFIHIPADSDDPVIRGPNIACGPFVATGLMVSTEPLPPPRPVPKN